LPQLEGIPKAFEMSGRLSIRQADRSDIARLRWTRQPGSDEWVFASPLGNEVARIESSPRGARLTRAGAPGEEASSFSELTQHVLGIALDPDQMSAWLHGRRDATGLPADWKVTIDETQTAGTVQLARRVTATRGDVVLRLVVDEYRVPDR
jgi:outer membrane biogenesis lipoprotein LolB